MSDDTNFGADVLTESETLSGTWEYNGDTYDLIVEDMAKRDLDVLQQYQRVAQQAQAGAEVDADLPTFSFEPEGGSDEDFIALLVEEKLVKPEVDPEAVRTHKLRPLFEGMAEAWFDGTEFQAAKQEMPVEGNRNR